MSYTFQAEGPIKSFGRPRRWPGPARPPGQVRCRDCWGRTGGRKTTAVRALATQLRPDRGRAMAGGPDVVRDARRVRRMIGLTGQYTSVDGDPFLDEPTTGLDPCAREEAWRMIRALAGGGVTVLLTTQYLEEPDALAGHICVVDHGKVIADGTPADLKRVISEQTVVVRPADSRPECELACRSSFVPD